MRLWRVFMAKITAIPATEVVNRVIRDGGEKYRRDMKPYLDAELWEARAGLVAAYRAHPGSWPDGIDSKYDRWYVAGEWVVIDGVATRHVHGGKERESAVKEAGDVGKPGRPRKGDAVSVAERVRRSRARKLGEDGE
jgi:hypothetical protein